MRRITVPRLAVSRSVRTFLSASGVTASLTVEHRVLRLGPVRVGRHGVRRVEATVGGAAVTLDVPRISDPWVTAALGVLVVWVSCAALLAAARWRRERPDAGPTHA